MKKTSWLVLLLLLTLGGGAAALWGASAPGIGAGNEPLPSLFQPFDSFRNSTILRQDSPVSAEPYWEPPVRGEHCFAVKRVPMKSSCGKPPVRSPVLPPERMLPVPPEIYCAFARPGEFIFKPQTLLAYQIIERAGPPA